MWKALEGVAVVAGISWGAPAATQAANGWRQLEDNAQWTGPSMAECAMLEGRHAIVDIAHQPTALQVAQSCRMLSMVADIGSAAGCSDKYDFAIVGVEEAVAALRCSSCLSSCLSFLDQPPLGTPPFFVTLAQEQCSASQRLPAVSVVT